MNKITKKIVTSLLALITAVSIIPTEQMTASAAPVPNAIQYRDNVYFQSLAYTGYDLDKYLTSYLALSGETSRFTQRDIGVLSGITYDDACRLSGMETTPDGLPDIAKFKEYGLVCASYVTYVYLNYLPNVAGVDTSKFAEVWKDKNTASAPELYETLCSMNSEDMIRRTKLSEAVPGDIVIFVDTEGNPFHASIAAYYNEDEEDLYVIHCGGDEGPVFVNSSRVYTSNGLGFTINVFHLPTSRDFKGSVSVNAVNPEGTKLSGAEFTAVNTANSKSYTINESDTIGLYELKGLPYGTYNITQTKFPDGAEAADESSWTAELNVKNDGKYSLTAVNITDENYISTGKLQISEKLSNESQLSDAEKKNIFSNSKFTVKNSSGKYLVMNDGAAANDGVYKYSGTASEMSDKTCFTPNSDGGFKIASLPVGEYTIEQISAPSGYAAQPPMTLNVTAGKESSYDCTVTFTGTEKIETLTVNNILPDGNSLNEESCADIHGGTRFTVKDEKTGKYVASQLSADGKYTNYSLSVMPYIYSLNSSGKFEIANLPTGKYSISAIKSHSEYTPVTQNMQIEISVDEKNEISYFNAKL